MALIRIEDPADPRVSGFLDIRERDLTGRQGLFVAEGEVVLNVLTSPQSLCRPVSLLIDSKRVEALGPIVARLDDDVPVFVAEQTVLDRIAGLHLHRGILALGRKPEPVDLPNALEAMGSDAVVLMACGIGNHDNMGGLFRNAAAFGTAAVLLDRTCCDPFYRKAIRVSVGAVLRTPMVTGLDAGEAVAALKAAGFEVLAMTGGASEALSEVRRAGRMALVVGAEGPGLPDEVIARCRPVGIRMAAGFDSLNVATAAGIALHHLTR
ncbi:MAG: RNA methyltransferase [Brevundimonas sp.]|uniref:TrmH family RNA methyltransferase n=1 Tax=Brevundimonas sp. TaxID=1871086 RepID=UPI001A1D1AD2|nr:RNA methyltransferase [Brevundimonas sp.]MBJ7447867.1 RNA methyltransferase [Brevundimonas sp.]